MLASLPSSPAKRLLPLLPILILAALVRLHRLDVVPFGYDEALLLRTVTRWIDGGPFPLAGTVSSAGFHFPPWALYLLAPALALWRDPLAVVAWIASLDVVATALLYALGWRMGGPRAAWMAALLYATSPWAILYARYPWGISLSPWLAVLLVLAVWLALVEGRHCWLAVALLAAALVAQIHSSGLVMAPWLAAVLILFHRSVSRRALVAGGALALLSALPYLLFQLRNGAQELAAVRARFGGEARVDGEVLAHMARLATGAEIHGLAGERFRDFIATVPFALATPWLMGALVVAALAWLLARALRPAADETRAGAWLLLLWLLAPLPLYLRHSVPVAPHYLITLLPLFPLLVGVAVGAWGNPRAARLLAPLILLVALAQGFLFVRLIDFVGDATTPGGLAIPLRDWRAAAAGIRAMPVCEVKVISDGTWPLWHEQPAIVDALLPDDPRLLYFDAATLESEPPYDDGRTLLVLPPPPADAAPAARELAARPLTAHDIPLRASEGAIRLLYEDGGRAGAAPGALEPVRFANGTRLIGYAVGGEAAPGATVRLFLYWELGPPPDGELYVYNPLLAADGARAGQQDGYLCAPQQWHAEQRVWTWYDIAIAPDAPPGPYHLRTGLYTYPDISNVPTEDGEASSDGVTLPLP